MSDAASVGLLPVKVLAPPVIAGTAVTVNLIIRNPFPEPVEIESIQGPSSAPLLPAHIDADGDTINGSDGSRVAGPKSGSMLTRLRARLGVLQAREINFGFAGFQAKFSDPAPKGLVFNIEPDSKFTINAPFSPDRDVVVNAGKGTEIDYDAPVSTTDTASSEPKAKRIIPPQQEDLASFEIKTAHWLLVKPKVLELHALIRYTVGGEQRSQVIPVTPSIQPPVKAIIIGSVSGAILGYLARQLNSEFTVNMWGSALIGIVGIIVTATILAIVLSRQESSKGFVTLEDFYGSFVVGAALGFAGTGFFEDVIGSTAPTGSV